MTTREEALAIFQHGYYDPIDRGDAAAAAESMAAEVEWSHRSAWQSDELGISMTDLDQLHSRDEVREFLSVAAPNVVRLGMRHIVTDLVISGEKGAFLTEVTSTKDSQVAQFMVWFELTDGLVSLYIMRPL